MTSEDQSRKEIYFFKSNRSMGPQDEKEFRW